MSGDGPHLFKAKVHLHTSMATGQTQVHRKCTHKARHRDTQVNANVQTVNREKLGHAFSHLRWQVLHPVAFHHDWTQ